MSVDNILNERASTYGVFYDLADVAQHLRRSIHHHLAVRGKILSPDKDEALTMICSKIARIINGDDDHIDSWRDIAGYAQLVADRLEGKTR